MYEAVNQCIGSTIRHAKDYAFIYLIDTRYQGEGVQPNGYATNMAFGPSLRESTNLCFNDLI